MKQAAILTALTLLPKSLLSKGVGKATRLPVSSKIHQKAARAFARILDIDTDEAALTPDECATFADFFTRPLKEGARPIAVGDDVVVSPVDARVSAFGIATGGRMIQAKGRDYSLAALLDDSTRAERFMGGTYLTLYLSPRDYHRIHAPLAGAIEACSVIPGELFPVNGPSVRSVPNLFCVNERLITYLSTAAGEVAVVKVGATCVGAIRASYCDLKTRESLANTREQSFEPPLAVDKGAELGVFEMGSTVILVFEPGRVTLDAALTEGDKIRMGQAIGRVTAGKE
ncbi:MAG: archaetidylserine decarboxylase [Myxococcales bacterium]|jgi:phosphatidylserine decarboxylase|nr:archaetidylserine decarboxylase [Myxococcales bacterium]